MEINMDELEILRDSFMYCHLHSVRQEGSKILTDTGTLVADTYEDAPEVIAEFLTMAINLMPELIERATKAQSLRV